MSKVNLAAVWRTLFEVVALVKSRSVEQTALFDSPDTAYTTGFIHGLNRSLARTGIGVYEVGPGNSVPAVSPVLPLPQHPDQCVLTIIPQYGAADSMFATDTYVGYGGNGKNVFLVSGLRFQSVPVRNGFQKQSRTRQRQRWRFFVMRLKSPCKFNLIR